MLQSMKDVVIQVIGRREIDNAAKGKEGNKETPRRMNWIVSRILILRALSIVCSTSWNPYFSPVLIGNFTFHLWRPSFLILSSSLSSFLRHRSFRFDRRYSFFVSDAPFIARILLLRFPFIVQPLFSRPDIVFPRARVSPSTLSSNCFPYSWNFFLALRLFYPS